MIVGIYARAWRLCKVVPPSWQWVRPTSCKSLAAVPIPPNIQLRKIYGLKCPGYRLLIDDEIQRLRYRSITSSASHFYHARSGFFLFTFVLFYFCCKTVSLCMLLHNCDLKAGEAMHPIFTGQVDQDKKCTRISGHADVPAILHVTL